MTEIRAVQGDITTLEVEAIVNAANIHLHHGGGVALAIARAGGPAIQIESDEWIDRHGPLESGVAAVTSAGAMPGEIVVHVAGPIHHEGQDNEGLLRTAVTAALDAASHRGCRSVALPAISAGIYGYPLGQATAVIAAEVRAWVESHPDALDSVLLVGYDSTAADAFRSALEP